MAGRGRGRGAVLPIKLQIEKTAWMEVDSANHPMNVSLDDLIHRQGKTGTLVEPSKYVVDVKGRLGNRNTQPEKPRNYTDDVYKSLDAVISDRGILQPPSKRDNARDGPLPITGKSYNRSRTNITSQDMTPHVGYLDPRANALEDIIEDRGIGKELEGQKSSRVDQMKRRNGSDRALDRNGLGVDNPLKRRRITLQPVQTPYRAVGYLKEKGMLIEMKIGKKKAEREEDQDVVRKWRCIWLCGSIMGIADSRRKVLAREMASEQFLKKLQEVYPEGNVPKYVVPDELFLDPRVFEEVQTLADESGIDLSFDLVEYNALADKGGCDRAFKCTYIVGGQEFTGCSPDNTYARLKAAYQVYESLTGEAYPISVAYVGRECDLDVEYDFDETEVYQTVHFSTMDDPDTVDFPQGKMRAFCEDRDEALRKMARRELAQNFEKSKKEEEARRRNMPIQLEPRAGKQKTPSTFTLEPRAEETPTSSSCSLEPHVEDPKTTSTVPLEPCLEKIQTPTPSMFPGVAWHPDAHKLEKEMEKEKESTPFIGIGRGRGKIITKLMSNN